MLPSARHLAVSGTLYSNGRVFAEREEEEQKGERGCQVFLQGHGLPTAKEKKGCPDFKDLCENCPTLSPFVFVHHLAVVGFTPSCRYLWCLFVLP